MAVVDFSLQSFFRVGCDVFFGVKHKQTTNHKKETGRKNMLSMLQMRKCFGGNICFALLKRVSTFICVCKSN